MHTTDVIYVPAMLVSNVVMLFLGLRVDENVINEYYDKRVKVFMKDFVHEIHKRAGALVRPNDITRNS